jgi:hypothetical protein
MRKRLSFSNVASALALFLAVGGGSAFALAGSNTVDSGDIRDGQVKTRDIANNAVTTKKIKNAPSGSDAVNADKIDGVSSEDLQFGDGITRAFGRISIPNGNSTTVVNLAGGDLRFTCGASPGLAYEDVASNPTFVTDLWFSGDLNPAGTLNHYRGVSDAGSLQLVPTDPNGTASIQTYAEAINWVRFSWHRDTTTSECTISASLSINTQG